MTTIINQLTTWYTYLMYDLTDPRIQDLPFMNSPWYFIFLIGFYMYFIFSLGPKIMEKRQPFKLDRILQIYNILQIILSLVLFAEAARLWLTLYNFACEPVDYSYTPHATRIARYVWLYFMNKQFDLLDTIFFILKKKQNQMSFLHIYHHLGMAIGSWICAKHFPGGTITFLGLINTFVHAIMYLYYLLSSMKINKISHWKKHLTQMQIIQFFILSLHFSLILWTDCGFPKWIAFVMIPQNVFMLVLFGEFYYNAYIMKKPTKEAISTKSETNGITTNIVNRKLKEQ